MPRAHSEFSCSECGTRATKWVGRCPGCSSWNTLVEEVVVKASGSAGGARRVRDAASLEASGSPGTGYGDVPMPIGDVDLLEWLPRPSGIDELDRVLGGGLVPGSVTLVGGEPGIGKSTLLLQLLGAVAAQGIPVLYVSAEESKAQVRLRAERLGMLSESLWLVSEVSLPRLLDHIDTVRPALVVIDSIQTIYDPALSSAPGSVAQVRGCAAQLVYESKARDLTTVIVGHVTKEGSIAGPRVLEHLVDTVMSFEGDTHHSLRMLRTTKHRFGATGQLGLFEMTGAGLVGVDDASGMLLADRREGVPGSVVVPTIEGHRPLMVEVQALVSPTGLPAPRRSAQGLDSGRLATILAVLTQRSELVFTTLDVYASAVGGVKVVEPAVDLALALALTSALTDCPVSPGVVACGEVGLAGEIRQVSHTERRLEEASRLGFKRALVPLSAPPVPAGIDVLRVGTLNEALVAAGLTAFR